MALIDCTTETRVKAALNISGTSEDAWIDDAIKATSQLIEQHLGRHVEDATYTEEYDVRDGRQEIVALNAYPVTSITSIKNAPDWDFAGATALTSTSYRVKDETGLIYFRTELDAGNDALQIVYVGGMAANTAAIESSFPAIAMAADLQIAAMFRRRRSPQGETINAGRGGSISQEGPLTLIPAAINLLSPFVRRRFGM
jgi:hypothetical protein